MQQIVVRIPDSQKILLTSLAQKRNSTVSDLTREGLELLLASVDKKEKISNENLLKKLLAIGKGQKGPKNLSSTYKKVLYR